MGAHISQLVAQALLAAGFEQSGLGFRKRLAGIAPAGSFVPDGGRYVEFQLDESGRWLEYMEGFTVARDCDLRRFPCAPWEAIAAVCPYAARLAYEADCIACPTYPHNGKARPPWEALDAIARQSWERKPSPRWQIAA